MSKKVIAGIAGACVLLLTLICGAMFYVSWTTMTTMAQLREENYRLSLEATSYRMRLEEAGVNVSALPPPKTTAAKPSADSDAKKAAESVQTPAVDAKEKATSTESKETSSKMVTGSGENPTATDTKKEDAARPAETNVAPKNQSLSDSKDQSADEGKKAEPTAKQPSKAKAKSKEKSKGSKVFSRKRTSKSNEKTGTFALSEYF